MAGVFFDTTVGGDGSTVTDDDNPTTGLMNGGSIIRIVPMFQQVVNIALWVKNKALEIAGYVSIATNAANAAALSAASAAQQANTLTATSSTSTTIGTGSKTFTTQAGEQFVAGQFVTVTSQANPANYMYGQVTSYSTTSLIVNVTAIGGTGTFADWLISLSGLQGIQGIQGNPGLDGITTPPFLLNQQGII